MLRKLEAKVRAPDLRKLVTASGHAKVGRRCDREENRTMRRLVVALLVVALALTLAGCGGKTKRHADTGTTQRALPQRRLPHGVRRQLAMRSSPTVRPPRRSSTPRCPSRPPGLPADIQKRLDKKQPVLLYVFDKTQKSSAETRSEVDAAMKSYRGLIDLVAYDASRYVTTDAETGAVTVDPKLSADTEASKVVKMLEQLKVSVHADDHHRRLGGDRALAQPGIHRSSADRERDPQGDRLAWIHFSTNPVSGRDAKSPRSLCVCGRGPSTSSWASRRRSGRGRGFGPPSSATSSRP